MRKLICILMALLLLGCAAQAENFELDFEDFTISVPEGTVGSVADAIESNVPFFIFYQDFDPQAVFNKSLNCVWNPAEMDITAMDPAEFARASLSVAVVQYASMGIQATEPMLYTAGYDSHDGRNAISYLHSLVLDYSGAGREEVVTVYTMQFVVPIEGSGTYSFTLSTDDMEGVQMLMDIMNSISWAR